MKWLKTDLGSSYADQKSSSVGETECGIGNTSSWKMCGIDPTASYGIYFEIANQGGPTPVQQGPQRAMVQFLTTNLADVVCHPLQHQFVGVRT
jgi:hypothetical protein